ncbi:MAG: glycosyltransferase [Cyclobacteriaceae bacterium]|nr:glycosyltransferase [Cyclobacteriaceae bacterium]
MEVKDVRIRVLFTIPNFDTAGSGKALLNIATRLDQILFEPMICCQHDRGDFFRVVKESGIPVYITDSTASMTNRLRGLAKIWHISRQLRKMRPDIIHSFHYAPDYSEPLAAILAGCKWVYTKKNMSWGGSSKNAWWLRSRLANGIITINSQMPKLYFEGYRNVRVIYRGVNVNEFSFRDRDRQLMMDLDIPVESEVVVTVANLVPVKGIEVLLTAFGLLQHKRPKLHLIVVGDNMNDYGNQLKEFVRDQQWSGRVHFVGKQKDVRPFLSLADIFVLPTLNVGRQEAFGVSLLEAMSSGVPVLASDVVGIREQLKNFDQYLFGSGNSSELADKLTGLLSMDRHSRLNVGRLLREHVLNSFTIEREVQEHEKFYHEILNSNT